MQTTTKRSSKFTKKITHVDDMMIHNLCYFYISQAKSSLDKIVCKIVYHYIIYMCDFFSEFKRLFCHDLHGFSRKLWFPQDTMSYLIPLIISQNLFMLLMPFYRLHQPAGKTTAPREMPTRQPPATARPDGLTGHHPPNSEADAGADARADVRAASCPRESLARCSL